MSTLLSPLITALLRNPETPTGVIRDALLDEGHDVATIYLVSRNTGSYSDWNSVPVAVFLDEAQATSFRDRLNQWLLEHGFHYNSTNNPPARTLRCPFDPAFRYDYDGSSYVVDSVPLRLYEPQS